MSQVIESKLPCPNCPSSDAFHLYDDGHGYCFSCEYFQAPEGKAYVEEEGEATYQYIDLRGVTKASFDSFGVKAKVNSKGTPVAVGFPYPNGSTKIRLLNRKHFYWSGEHRPGLFGRDRFAAGSHKHVTITEGELDAISLWQVLKAPVVSVQSSGSASADVAADHNWLSSFDKIYLAFDGDAAGRDATSKVAKLFDPNKIFHVKFTRPDRKDANAYLESGEADELKFLWYNAKKYLPEQVISSNLEFKKILQEPHKQGVPYPLTSKLNDMTYGIRTGESVLITAQEGIGKTEVMHAIEYKLLRDTDANVAAIFLEEPKRRHLQALAGIHLKKPVHLPDTDCTQDEVYAALEETFKKDDRLYLYNHFGSDSPTTLLDTIRFLVVACGCSYVLLDHITMAVSGLSGEDERRALDWFSTQIEMMVKELDYALIIVSHVNDLGQTRGSRYISKVADIRLDLSRDILSPDIAVRNRTDLCVSKNRFSGRTGSAGGITYYPEKCTWKEEDTPWPTTLQTSPSIVPNLEPPSLVTQ